MSDPARRLARGTSTLCRVSLMTALVVSTAAAQVPNVGSIAGQRDVALAEIRRLDPLLVQRIAESQRLDAELEVAEQRVEVAEGAIRLRVSPELADEARIGARIAVAALAPTQGSLVQGVFANRIPVFGLHWQKERFGTSARIWTRADTGDRGRAHFERRWTLKGASEDIGTYLVTLAEEVAAKRADSALQVWLQSPRIPLSDRPRRLWTEAYVTFAATSSIALRDCRQGRRDDCLTSLGLASDGTAGLDRWYDATDYPALLDRVVIARTDTASRALARLCLSKKDPEACAMAVSRLAPRDIPAPLSALARALFLHEVLRVGGAGSYERLLSAKGTLRERLAFAAGRPLDDVVDRWYERMVAARPSAMTVSPVAALALLSWCALFTLVGFSRKSLA